MPWDHDRELQPLVMCLDGDVPSDYSQELLLPRDGPGEDVPLYHNREQQPLVMCLDGDVPLDYNQELVLPRRQARRCALGLYKGATSPHETGQENMCPWIIIGSNRPC